MTIQSTAGNRFRTAAYPGFRQRVARRGPLALPGGLPLWRAVGKTMLWGLPVVLGINLWLASMCNSYTAQAASTQQLLLQEKKNNAELALKRSRLFSPVRLKIAAAAKLDLHEPAAKQVKRM